MTTTTKAALWTLCVFIALWLGVHFAGCGGDENGPDADWNSPSIKCKAAGDACEGGRCFAVTGGTIECFKECPTVGEPCDTGACYYFNMDGNRGFFCDKGGPHYPGDACGAATECVAGAQCLDQGGTMNCYQVCTDTCDAGDCTDTELGFKVCVAEA